MRSLEPVDVAVGLFSAVLAPELAEILGPYAVIMLASTLGAGWSLGGKEKLSRLDALWFFLKINATAFLITVAIVNYIASTFHMADGKWLFAPIALIIGIIGDDWASIGSVLVHRVKDFISNFKRKS